MADGRHLEKMKNRHISAAVLAISTKFGMQTHFDLLSVPTVKNLKFPKSKMAAAAILDFQKLEISTSGPIRRPNMRHRTKFREDWSNRSGDMADFRFFRMAAVRHLGLVLRVLGPPTKSTWWSLRLCKIWW